MERRARGMLRPYASELSMLHRLLDALWIAGSLWLCSWLLQRPWNDKYTIAAAMAVAVFYFASEASGLYGSWRSAPVYQEVGRVIVAWLILMLVMLFLGYASKTTAHYSRLAFGAWFVIAPLGAIGTRLVLRFVLRELRSRGHNTRSVVIVGAGDLGSQVAHSIAEAPWTGLKVLGFYDDRNPQRDRVARDNVERICGNIDALVDFARSGTLDMVYITLPLRANDRIQELIDRLADTTVSVYLVPDFFTYNVLYGRWLNLGDLPAVSVYETPFYGAQGWLKRVEDIVLASIILLLIAVPMLVIAIGVKLSSHGPVLFKQRRYGLDGRSVNVWKFRSMSVCENGLNVRQAKRDDPRVTPFGAFLRRTSLDELPQFINVICGQMSIVGPRPHAVAHNEHYRKMIRGYMLRHKVKPGITGWAQVSGWRGQTDTLDKMKNRIEHDLWYIKNWSFWLDIKIVFLTVLRGFVGKAAY